MTFSLFGAAHVVDGDGDWTVGYDTEVIRAAGALSVSDWCSVSPQVVAGNNAESVPVYRISSFSAQITAKRPVRCSPAEASQIIHDLLIEQTERAASYALWFGVPGWGAANAYLLNSDVTSVGQAATPLDTVASAFAQYATKLVNFQESVLHLGLSAAVLLDQFLTDEGTVRPTGGKFVISESYPPHGVAVTGPVVVHTGSIQDIEVISAIDNRKILAVNRLVSVEFEPCTAVRVD